MDNHQTIKVQRALLRPPLVILALLFFRSFRFPLQQKQTGFVLYNKVVKK